MFRVAASRWSSAAAAAASSSATPAAGVEALLRGLSSRQQQGAGGWGGGGGATATLHSSATARSDDAEAAHTVVEFTPDQSAAGGMLIGLAAASKLGFTGRILGVSGIVGGLVRGDASAWRLSWLGGLASGAVAMSVLHPEGFFAFPETYSLARALCGGLLVGLGTSLGSGCTSGHGICGLARLSPRSLVATGTFMAAGVASAALTGSLAATGVDVAAPTALALMSDAQWQLAATLGGGSLAAVATLRGLAGASSVGGGGGTRPRAALEHLAEFCSGATMAAGLALSGMLLPSKVAGFLTPLVPAWDGSLMFVMGGALAVTLPAFQYVLRRRSGSLCAGGFCLPSSTQVDKQLVLGSLMFGTGWGMAGVCPGPALVSAIGAPGMHSLALVGAMLAGMALHKRLVPLYARLLKP